MRTLVYLFLLTLCCGCGQADTPAQSAVPAGIIILREVPGYPAAATPFVSIQWVNTNGGYVADAAGNKTPFINDAIGKIIYFNQNYYDEIDHNQYWVDWRAGLQSREVVMPPVDTISLSPDDLPRLRAEDQVWQDIVQHNPVAQSPVAPVIATLDDDITKLSGGLVLQNGQWLDAKVANATATVSAVGDGAKQVTFTTKNGKTYVNAKVMVSGTSVNILTSDGGASVPFDQMPDDLSAFPKSVQIKVQAMRPAPEQDSTAPSTSSTSTSASGFLDFAWSFIQGTIQKIGAYFSSAPTPAPSASATTNSASPGPASPASVPAPASTNGAPSAPTPSP